MMIWYIFFVLLCSNVYCADHRKINYVKLIHPEDFVNFKPTNLQLLCDDKPMSISKQKFKNDDLTHISLIPKRKSTVSFSTRDIEFISRVPYSIENDYDENYLALKHFPGVWTGHYYRKFNREISLLLLYLILFKQEHPEKKKFIIADELYDQIANNQKFKKIFESYNIGIDNSIINKIAKKTSFPIIPFKISFDIDGCSWLCTFDRYRTLFSITPIELLTKKYGPYYASLMKNSNIFTEYTTYLRPLGLFEKKHQSETKVLINKVNPFMVQHCQDNDFSLFNVKNQILFFWILRDLMLIDLLFEIRFEQIKNCNCSITIYIPDKLFAQVKRKEAFCQFLKIFNIACYNPYEHLDKKDDKKIC